MMISAADHHLSGYLFARVHIGSVPEDAIGLMLFSLSLSAFVVFSWKSALIYEEKERRLEIM